MKKLLTLAALVGASAVSYGQGYVNFANAVGAATHVSTNSVVGGALTGQTVATANQYYFELLVSTTATTVGNDFAGWTALATGANTASLGRFTGNPTTQGVPVPGTNPADTINVAVVGWSANIGTSWNDALAFWHNGDPTTGSDANLVGSQGWFGYTATPAIGYTLGGGSQVLAALFGTTGQPNQLAGFGLNVYSVPEPGSLALAGLGAAAMLIFRRRK